MARYGLRDILDVTFRNFVTKKPFLYMDYATAAENEWTGDQVFARGGRGNPKRISFNDPKDATLTLSTQIFTMKHLAMLTGKSLDETAQDLYRREVLTVEGGNVELQQEPIEGDEDYIEDNVVAFIYDGGVDGDEVTVTDVTGKVVTLDTADGNEVAVYYQYNTGSTDVQKITFTSGDFPSYWEITGDTLFADELGGQLVPAQLIYYKAKPQTNFTLSMSPEGDPTTLEIVFDLFPVQISGEDVMLDMILHRDEDLMQDIT